MVKFFSTLLVLALLAGGALAGGHKWLHHWAVEPRELAQPVEVTLTSGTGLKHLSTALAEKGAVSSAFLYSTYVRLSGTYSRFQAGRYRFEGAVSPARIAQDFVEGKIYVEVAARFTIPEGFTMKKIAARLAANGIGSPERNLKLMRSPAFIRTLPFLAKMKLQTVEGFLYPATYSFTKMPTPEDAITAMTTEFFKRLPADYEARASAKKLSLVDAVKFASLIELETLHEDEKELVSEVIWRRLKDNAPLGIDAALIYGIEDYDGDLRWRDLGDRKNPFNTRVFKGLPPTPIGSVTLTSLEAVLKPTNEGNYYYVLLPGSEQRHHFSRTLAEHNEHVRKLVRASKKDKEASNGPGTEKNNRQQR